MSPSTGTDRSQETFRILRENITSGTWPLNSQIPTEAALMAELGVGRSTVREAVRSLANLGMLETARSRGTFVRSRTPVSALLSDFIVTHDVAEILTIRQALEVQAGQLAAGRRTEDDIARLRSVHDGDVSGDCSQLIERGRTPGQFHALIFDIAGNRLLSDLYAGIMVGLRSALRTGEVVHGSDDATRHADHESILTAILDGDADRAARVIADHARHDLIPRAAPD